MNGFKLKKQIVIWGAGARGKALARVLGYENVSAFIDNNIDKKGKVIRGCPVVSFEDYRKERDHKAIVISSLNYEKEIIRELNNYDIDYYFVLSDEISELQGRGNLDFLKYIPLPSDKTDTIAVLGSTLYACIYYEWLKGHGYNSVYLYTDDKKRRQAIKSIYEYDFLDTLDNVDLRNCYIATREAFIWDIKLESMIDIFDVSDYIPEYYNKNLTKYKGLYSNEKCFIIGNGPSLLLDDVRRLKGVVTFGTNRIYLLSKNWKPDYYACGDLKILEDKKVFDFEVKKKFFSDVVKDRLNDKDEWIHEVHSIPNDESYIIPFSEDISRKVYTGASITYVVMQIAAYMGFSEIYLLGVDCDYPNDSSSHFYGNDFDEGGDPMWIRPIRAFKSAKKYADTHGIKIYNATRGGKLEVFERVDFDSLDFLK